MPHRDSSILIVDDQAQGRMILVQILRALGCTYLEEAASGQEALKRLEMNDPHFPCELVFCDLFMPRMSGMELLIVCRTRPELEKIAFVMVASEGDQGMIQAALEAGASDHILKPFSNETIAQVDRKLRRLAFHGRQARAIAPAPVLLPPRVLQERFLQEMRRQTGLSEAQMGEALRFLVQAFGQRIQPSMAAQFARQLPVEFEGVILNSPGGPNASITEAFVLNGLGFCCDHSEARAWLILKGFCRGLKEVLNPQATEALCKALPEGFSKFFYEFR